MEKLVFETSNLPLPFGGSIWMEGKKSERIGKKKMYFYHVCLVGKTKNKRIEKVVYINLLVTNWFVISLLQSIT